LLALCDMAFAGKMGVQIEYTPEDPHAFWFGEDQARYVVAVENASAFEAAAGDISITKIGTTGTDTLTFADGVSISLETLRTKNENWLPEFMNQKPV
jgi:phosphoribosylformylglycinamidine synthase subunit PurL